MTKTETVVLLTGRSMSDVMCQLTL